jgi:glycerate kinase
MSAPARVVLAPDKFKGTLTAAEVAEALAAGLRGVAGDVVLSVVPVADGGDGTLAVALARGFRPVQVPAADALGHSATAVIGVCGDHAFLELATICGLQRLPQRQPRPEHATTVGLGQAVRAALAAGCTRITIGLGGSASTDGGAGLLTGLGARLLDAVGDLVPPTPVELHRITAIDLTGLDPLLQHAKLEVAVDVDAPLLGPDGAAVVFGPQKGADAATVARLEQAMRHWAELLSRVGARPDPARPGSGAAGGTAFAALALGARLVDGAEALLDLAGFDDTTVGADLVITGEGRLDRQTLMGKAPAVVARRSARLGVPVVAVVGSRSPGLDDAELAAHGFDEVHELVDLAPTAAGDVAASRSALTALGVRIAQRHLRPPHQDQLDPVPSHPLPTDTVPTR